MKIKNLVAVVFCLMILGSAGLAEPALQSEQTTQAVQVTSAIPAEDKPCSLCQTENLFQKIKYHRGVIYSSLNLTSEQAAQVQALDKKYFTEIEPEFQKVNVLVKNLEDIAKSRNCTMRAVNKETQKLKRVEKKMNHIKESYNKELDSILTPEQKVQYEVVRKKQQVEIERQLKEERLMQTKSE